MEFHKYSSLENHYREKVVEQFRARELANEVYILTEKVHGANFSFWTDGKSVQVASRSQFVDGTFYGCQDVIDLYHDAVLRLHSFLELGHGNTLTVYGELFGPKIQKGVKYATDKDFVAFDIAIDGRYMAQAEAADVITNNSGFNFVPVIDEVIGLDAALEYSNEFESVLARRNGISDPENIAEGLVIQVAELGNIYFGDTRAIIKSKNDKWAEKVKTPKRPRVEQKDDPLVPLVEQYVNENRMHAVLSKIGDVTVQQFGEIIKAMGQDVIEDMVKDGDVPDNWRDVEEYENLGKSVNKVVVPFLKKELLPKL